MARLAVVRTIVPSNITRPDLVSPIATPRRKARAGEFIASNDDEPVDTEGAQLKA